MTLPKCQEKSFPPVFSKPWRQEEGSASGSHASQWHQESLHCRRRSITCDSPQGAFSPETQGSGGSLCPALSQNQIVLQKHQDKVSVPCPSTDPESCALLMRKIIKSRSRYYLSSCFELGTVPSTFQILNHLIHTQARERGSPIISILQMRKLRLREAKSCATGLPVTRW